MTPELDKYYQDRFSMMGTQGWIDLIEDIKVMRDASNSLDGITNGEQLMYRKGEISLMNWLISLHDVSEEAYEELKRDENPA